jgi:hypothetical protein
VHVDPRAGYGLVAVAHGDVGDLEIRRRRSVGKVDLWLVSHTLQANQTPSAVGSRVTDNGAMPTYRARFDATVTFTNGGGLQAQGFLVDVPSSRIT